MKSLFGGLLIITGAVAVAVGVLAGMEALLQSPGNRRRAERVPAPQPGADFATSASTQSSATSPMGTPANIKSDSERNFSIKRTKSEVGYVYWILEGYGKYKCFVLCDSWDEAVAQAKAKLAEVDAMETSAPSISVSV